MVKMNIAAAQTRKKEQYDRKHYNPDVFRWPGRSAKVARTREQKRVRAENKNEHEPRTKMSSSREQKGARAQSKNAQELKCASAYVYMHSSSYYVHI